jgi:hypothetical protein
MAPKIILPKEFDVSRVTFSDVKVLDNGGKIVYVSYDSAPLVIQTPTMTAPFGMSVWDNDGKAAAKYSLDLSFKNMDASPKLQKFYEMLEQLDNKLVNDGFLNQATWFKGKKYGSREILEALFTPMIKYAKDRDTGERTDKYPPTMKIGIPCRDGRFSCDIFDDKKRTIDLNAIETKGAAVTAIIQCTGLWFAGGKFGASWRLVQAKIVANSMSFDTYAFRGDGDNDGNDDAEIVDCTAQNGDDDHKSSSDSEEEDDA